MTTLLNNENIKLRLVKNPFDVSDVAEESLVYNPDFSIADYMQGLPDPESWLVGHNGLSVSCENWSLVKPQPGDTLSLVVIPEGDSGKEILRYAAIIAVAVAAWQTGQFYAVEGAWTAMSAAASATVAIGGNLLINAVLPPPTPDIGATNGEKEKRNYGIDGAKNTSRQGIAIPKGFGRYRVAGNICDHFTENIGNDQYLLMRINLNDGPIKAVNNIQINDQPIDNFDEVETRINYGDEDRTEVDDWFGVTQTLDNRNTPITTNDIIHTTDACDQLRVDLAAPRGLVQFNKKGKKENLSVEIEVQYRKKGDTTWLPFPAEERVPFSLTNGYTGPVGPKRYDVAMRLDPVPINGRYDVNGGVRYRKTGGSWVDLPYQRSNVSGQGDMRRTFEGEETPVVEKDFSFETDGDPVEIEYYGGQPVRSQYRVPSASLYRMSGAQTSAIRRTLKSRKLDYDEYEIRVRRTTEPTEDTQTVDQVFLTDVGELIVSPVTHAGIAQLSLRIKITDQISSTPNVTSECDLSLYNTYNEDGSVLEEQVWGQNPAWIVIAILTDPITGAGMKMSRIDWEAFSDLAEWCEDNGITWNGTFDDIGNVYEKCQAVLRVARAQFVRIGMTWSVAIDRSADPVTMFGDGNILEGTMSVEWMAMNERANEIQLTFQDADNDYKQGVVRLVDQDIGVTDAKPRATKYDGIGITNMSQATEEAESQLRRNKLLRKTVSFDAPVESIGLNIGDVAYIKHTSGDYRDGVSGRLASGSTQTTLELDKGVDLLSGEEYSVLIHHPAIKRYEVSIDSVGSDYVDVSGLPTTQLEKCHRLKSDAGDYVITDVEDMGSSDRVHLETSAGLETGDASLWSINVLEERDVDLVGDQTLSTIPLVSELSEAPETYLNYFIGRKVTLKEPFRLLGFDGDDLYKRTLSFINYDENLYLPPGEQIPETETTLRRVVTQVRDVNFEYDPFPTGDTTESRVELSWQVEDRTIYGGADIYVRTDGGNWNHRRSVYDTTDAQIEVDRRYTSDVRVVAFSKTQQRASFGEAPIIRLDASQVRARDLDAPANLRISSVDYDVTGRATLEWDEPDDDVTSYRIDYRKIDEATYNAQTS